MAENKADFEANKQKLADLKKLDLNDDGHLGSAERANAFVQEAETRRCPTLDERRKIYQNAHGTSTPPTDRELKSFTEKTTAINEKSGGGMMGVAFMEMILTNRNDPAVKSIFPKGVEHSTPEDMIRSGEALSAKAVRCGRAASEELKR